MTPYEVLRAHCVLADVQLTAKQELRAVRFIREGYTVVEAVNYVKPFDPYEHFIADAARAMKEHIDSDVLRSLSDNATCSAALPQSSSAEKSDSQTLKQP